MDIRTYYDEQNHHVKTLHYFKIKRLVYFKLILIINCNLIMTLKYL